MELIVFDPDRLRLSTLSRNLRELGLSNTTVASIAELRKLIRKKKCDICLLDVAALTILDQLRKQHEEVPVILVADRNAVMNLEKAIFAGVAGLLLRPYRIDFLQKVLEKAIQRRNEIILNRKTVISLKRKVQVMQTLNEVVQAINSSLKPKEILNTIMAKAADLINAEGWSVLLFNEKTRELVFEAASGKAGKKLLGMRLRIGQGVAGWVARYGKSLMVPDVSKDPRFYSGVDQQTQFITKSVLCVPMKSRDRVIGVVEVVNKIGEESFTRDDFEIFENVVAHLTIALEKANLYRKMEHASLVDDLTQLYNTRYCNQFLDDFLIERKDTSGKISLIFLDIDFFKLVDDNFGHLVGSETLKIVGERMTQVVRKNDVIVRYGGDEYIVLLPNAEKKTALIIAERIRVAISRDPFYAFGNKKFSITVTLGVAAYPEDAKTRDDLIGKADKAMYEGKMSGRNKVVSA
ncbi:MAG: diguanylate cyclase [candidate division WOR-3 bacterium]|nr:MAG: diguanylate cyclase [candidate division WOR-3 bacterium]